MKFKLYVSTNCLSCMILGHYFMFDLDRYEIIKTSLDDKQTPYMVKGEDELRDIALMREIFSPQEISDDVLRHLIDNYDHRNCISCANRCDIEEEYEEEDEEKDDKKEDEEKDDSTKVPRPGRYHLAPLPTQPDSTAEQNVTKFEISALNMNFWRIAVMGMTGLALSDDK